MGALPAKLSESGFGSLNCPFLFLSLQIEPRDLLLCLLALGQQRPSSVRVTFESPGGLVDLNFFGLELGEFPVVATTMRFFEPSKFILDLLSRFLDGLAASSYSIRNLPLLILGRGLAWISSHAQRSTT